MRRILPLIIVIAILIAAAASQAHADADDRYTSPHDVQGVVTSFDSFNMTLRVNGREFPVQLHQGTIIRPTGTTLAPSMVVNIAGYWQGGTFYANKIVVLRF